MKSRELSFILASLIACSCQHKESYLEYALRAAGKNHTQLESVLSHYQDDPEKLAAAEFLIENMPAHFSYQGDQVLDYYRLADQIISSDLTPVQQRDSLLSLSDHQFLGMDRRTTPDVRIVTADFLIRNIDQAFDLWKQREWASHITFDEFCEYLLPYKAVELQQLDAWRDSLALHFGPAIDNMVRDDDQYGTVYYTVDAVRNYILDTVHPVGLFNRSGYPLLSADLLHRQTFGRCSDYVNLGVLTYRSLGIPVVIDETPYWGRYRAGHSWYTLLTDRGEHLPSEWDISSMPGGAFFEDKRISKVYRNTFAINRERARYRNTSDFRFPFSLCQTDVTDEYFRTSDIDIELLQSARLSEPYAYIATFTGHGQDWSIVDFGEVRRGHVTFSNMGRNVLYIVMGYDGKELTPQSLPFILTRTGEISFIEHSSEKEPVTIRRKYYESNNVAKMRQRILGGRIQASDRADFSTCNDIILIDSLSIPDKIETGNARPYRYWRYLAAEGTYGSIAELAFFEQDTTRIEGKPIAASGASSDAVSAAFDSDWLTNFETENPDGNWVGMDFGQPVKVDKVRIVPRSDDNDIHPGDLYELKYWDNSGEWKVVGAQYATENALNFANIPEGALLWLHNYTRGWDERPFLYNGGEIIWW